MFCKLSSGVSDVMRGFTAVCQKTKHSLPARAPQPHPSLWPCFSQHVWVDVVRRCWRVDHCWWQIYRGKLCHHSGGCSPSYCIWHGASCPEPIYLVQDNCHDHKSRVVTQFDLAVHLTWGIHTSSDFRAVQDAYWNT